MHEMNEPSGDGSHDLSTDELPGWARAAFTLPASSDLEYGPARHAAARAAIMDRVRREPRPLRSDFAAPDASRATPRIAVHVASRLSAPMRASRWTRRGLLTPFGAAAFAGVLGLLLSVRAVGMYGGLRDVGAHGATMSAVVIGDTVMPSLRDTLRIVEFVLRGPTVRSAAVVGDFNAWRRGATRLERRADGAWHARVIVPRDVVRFAYSVNDEPVDIPTPSAAEADRQAPRSAPRGNSSRESAIRARIDSI